MVTINFFRKEGNKMLLSINCSVVSSIKVDLVFDDGSKKHGILAIGDLVDIEYNSNGLRKRIYGRIINISAQGTDPNGWYLTVDGSDDFQSTTVRFSVMGIIDFTIIKKYDTTNVVETPVDKTGVLAIKVIDGWLYYTQDGVHWFKPRTRINDNHLQQEEGTVPMGPPPVPHVHHNEDLIEDENR
jgi:hypothetical protein